MTNHEKKILRQWEENPDKCMREIYEERLKIIEHYCTMGLDNHKLMITGELSRYSDDDEVQELVVHELEYVYNDLLEIARGE
jgi:hypothetical protein